MMIVRQQLFLIRALSSTRNVPTHLAMAEQSGIRLSALPRVDVKRTILGRVLME
jgi:hypothetical protein